MTRIKEFETIDEEVAFWESNDSADYWDEMEGVDFEIDLQTNALYPRLSILESAPKTELNGQQKFKPITLEYVAQHEKHLIVIRDVPAWQSTKDGRKFILEATSLQIEALLALEGTDEVQPVDTLQVPVFSLKAAA